MTKQFKVGDKVRVVGSPDGDHTKWDETKGFDTWWVEEMDGAIGSVYEVVNIESTGIQLQDNFYYPPQALELVESAKEQTFTLAEIEKAWNDWSGSNGFDGFKLELTKATDPDYKEYLRLKEKFE